MMLFINTDTSSFPYAKLLGTISGSFAAIMLAALEFEDTYEERNLLNAKT